MAAGFLEEVDAMNHEYGHLLLNLIGSADMRIEVGAPFRLARFDTMVLCSDGLTDNLNIPDIVNAARKGSLPSSMRSLTSACYEKMQTSEGQQDDLTIALFRRSQ